MKRAENMNSLQFLKQFVLHPTRTGALLASSDGLAKLITDSAELEDTEVVVEFGSGSGVFTERIVQKMPESGTFFAIESNKNFVEATRARCPNVKVYHGSAANARKYLQEHGRTQCDCIICGLPWASFKQDLQDELLDVILGILKPNGRFLTFAYLQGLLLPAGMRFRKKLRSRFTMVRTTRTVWKNIPPAFVYHATK